MAAGPRPAWAQLPTTEEERLQILTEPEAMKKKGEKDKNRAPFEFFRSQVAPFDVLPYVKANHWSTLWFEMRANDDDYDGYLKTDPVLLLGTPQEVTYRREARLLKEKRARLFLQMMIPSANGVVPKETGVELIRERALRPIRAGRPTLTTLPTHQMLVVDSEQGFDQQVRGLEQDDGVDPVDGRARRERPREAALLPAGAADGTRQGRPVTASADLDDDQSRDLGQLCA